MGMNIISKYIERLQVEEIAVDIISKIVSLLLLLIVFLIAKRVLNFIFTHAIAKSISLSRQTEARKKPL
ncbi:Potassium efflux system KefA protein/Small-conductance mechanosensitive channel [Streptococcus sp. HSISB1]|nr:Potassium efflux system KefA protein/Small-conductance mechanosensitive channel [Streptococcus sp. HSISB1]